MLYLELFCGNDSIVATFHTTNIRLLCKRPALKLVSIRLKHVHEMWYAATTPVPEEPRGKFTPEILAYLKNWLRAAFEYEYSSTCTSNYIMHVVLIRIQ